ncbi:MAG: gliding motility-associated C-terminal domain-containing protein [Bacteroidales bacterium]|nr:gliding motility-associated C-terminal domain-containing protein [Bacteroidales bacterium]
MKRLIFLTIIIFSGINLFATHNRAGQIVYEHVSGYTYKITITTYTYTLSQADRDSLPIDFGDGSQDIAPRTQKTTLPNNYFENIYEINHTFPGPGTFSLVVEDPNRNEGVINIPNSVNVIFALKTTLQINPFLGHNDAPVLLNKPIDKAALNQIFIHNPGAYDPDGDSLSYKMDTCRYTAGEKIPSFSLPAASTSIIVDEITGDLIWDSPVQIGIYNVALRIEEWREGVKISSIIRDIQIEVEETDNNPPEIDPIEDLCVIAGDYIQFDVTANDIDNDGIYLSASGGPFTMDISPAQFTDSVFGVGNVTGTFRWQTHCSHIRDQEYLVTFRAADNNPEVSLSDYESMYIRVIGPPVQFTDIEASNTNIILKWERSNCDNATGYKIYRRNSDENFTIEDCVTGMPESWGYTLAKTITNPDQTFVVDDHLSPGFYYCYRIVTVFDNKTDGVVSDKVCIEIAEGLPILTKASVDITDIATGQISVDWIKPINFDTILYKGPHRFLLEISRDLYGIDFGTPLIFDGLTNNSYTDDNINTEDNPSCYRLTLQNYDSLNTEWISVGYPTIASSPYLRIKSANEKNILIIDENVPWDNEMYVIYKYNENTSTFDSIGYTNSNTYYDLGLQNLKEYCYKVKSISHYTADSLPDPIINMSQINCGIPIDTIAPCCPDFEVVSHCEDFYNQITWTMPNDTCYESLEAVKIFYKNELNAPFELLATLAPDVKTYSHYSDLSLSACYYLTAIDSAGNESICEDFNQCVDNCSYYELPNVFTPNGDNINDLFHPYPYRFVDKIELKIYDRWGVLVFETDDPDINWDGKSMNSGKLVSDGVYYYICDVYEYRLAGIIPRNISGFIHIYPNADKKEP